ncbi:hypothetical protein NIES4101_27760 (plasmid) [Calothrix sp. NIES-4101]|nr:hypothetical protein NIES4101_27760 [Calothrix sp. NIES-4101]
MLTVKIKHEAIERFLKRMEEETKVSIDELVSIFLSKLIENQEKSDKSFPLLVAARKHKRSGLQTRKLLAQINCKSNYTSAHIICKQTHYYLQRACNRQTWLTLIANKLEAVMYNN